MVPLIRTDKMLRLLANFSSIFFPFYQYLWMFFELKIWSMVENNTQFIWVSVKIMNDISLKFTDFPVFGVHFLWLFPDWKMPLNFSSPNRNADFRWSLGAHVSVHFISFHAIFSENFAITVSVTVNSCAVITKGLFYSFHHGQCSVWLLPCE